MDLYSEIRMPNYQAEGISNSLCPPPLTQPGYIVFTLRPLINDATVPAVQAQCLQFRATPMAIGTEWKASSVTNCDIHRH